MFFANNGEASGGRGPLDDFWYGPVPGRSGAGVHVNDETALRQAYIYACVNVVSQDLAKVPLAMYRRTSKGRERVKPSEHPVVRLLDNPYRNMTGVDWRQRLQGHQLLRGNAFCQKQYDYKGEWTALRPWKPSDVRVEVMSDDSVRYWWRDPNTGTEKPFLEDEVLHLRGLSLDGPLGMSPIDQQRETIAEAIAAQRYGSTFFANDARPSLILEHPTNFRDDSVRREWTRAFRQAYGDAGRFSPMVLEYGMKLSNLEPLTHQDIQFVELRKLKGPEICAIYRVPPHKVGILDRSTNNNIEHQAIEYVTDCLLTWCRRWEARLSIELLDQAERDEYYFEFLLDVLMRGDTATRFEAYQKAIQSGWVTRNEIRRRENLDDLDGLDEPLEPLNMVPAGSQPAAEVPDKGAPNKGAEPTDDAQQESEDEARGRQLELQARRRVLNREQRALEREWARTKGETGHFQDAVATFYAQHLGFVEEALAIATERAHAYCLAQCKAIETAIAGNGVPQLLASWRNEAETLKFLPLPAAPTGKE